MLRLKSLTYTSDARPDLEPGDIRAVHHTARHLNALDGVTGLLIYNGRQFLQIIEGDERAIDALLQRLLADARHSGLTVEHERFVDQREFPNWVMELANVSTGDADAQSNLADLLPATIPETIRTMVTEMVAMRS